MSDLLEELETLLNRFSVENESNTPDFILAEYMMGALKAFEQATRRRDAWYGMNPEPGVQWWDTPSPSRKEPGGTVKESK
jgi:hypothetical protein